MNLALQHMLAFDIKSQFETLGLDPSTPMTYLDRGALRTVPNHVTCACAHNGSGVSKPSCSPGWRRPPRRT